MVKDMIVIEKGKTLVVDITEEDGRKEIAIGFAVDGDDYVQDIAVVKAINGDKVECKVYADAFDTDATDKFEIERYEEE